MKTIGVIGTMDTKGREHAFVAQLISARGHAVQMIDLGTGEEPQVPVDITRFQIAEAAGLDLQSLMNQRDRGECVRAMTNAAPKYLAKLVAEKSLDGLISLGGGGGTALGTAVMRALPVGFPKLMVSTLASGNTAHYVATKDILMMPSIVDVAGLNRIAKTIFTRAAGAICGMVELEPDRTGEKPLIVASMFGNTTDCINHAKSLLEQEGYEVLVFHATGIGGKTMESLIESGLVVGILDLTTTEWADQIVGGTLSAGPTRLDAMSRASIPAVVAPGCVDMVNFGEPETVPEQFEGRRFYQHNPQVTLMRTSAEENSIIGRVLAEKASANSAPVAILNPLKAVSALSAENLAFYDPIADTALFSEIRRHSKVAVIDLDEEINSPAFAEACVEKLLELIEMDSKRA